MTISYINTYFMNSTWQEKRIWFTWTNDVLKTCDFYLINKRVLYVCVYVCLCVCVFLSVCIIIIINIIFFFFVFYKRPRNHFRDIVGSRDKKIEINQITKLTKREKIVSWSNRVYRSIEGDVLRSSITTGHETNPSFHSSPFNLTRTSNGDHLLVLLSRVNIYGIFRDDHPFDREGEKSKL